MSPSMWSMVALLLSLSSLISSASVDHLDSQHLSTHLRHNAIQQGAVERSLTHTKRDAPTGGYGDGGYSYPNPQSSQIQGPAQGPQQGPLPQGGGLPPLGPLYREPGFSVQTGYEGLMVPNGLFGLFPFGGWENILIVVGAIIVIPIIIAVIGGLFCSLTGLCDKLSLWPLGGELAEKGDAGEKTRSLLNSQTVAALSQFVMDAIAKYNEIQNDAPLQKVNPALRR